jgi:acetyl esterase/lipase
MDLLSRPVLKASKRIAYGAGAFQFGDLWLPDDQKLGARPVVVFFHGGWWKSEYDLGYAGYLCAALAREGIACWSVEYRRVGSSGGGWPNTFEDAAAGFDFISEIAGEHRLNLSRMLVMGHSAGGHLAFWIAGRSHIENQSELFSPQPKVFPNAVIALAGAVDLRLIIELAGTGEFAHIKENVFQLMGGDLARFPERYRAGNPGELLPFSADQILIQGTDDDQIPPELPSRWAEIARKIGSKASVRILPGTDHFDVVDPESFAWATVVHEVRGALL